MLPASLRPEQFDGYPPLAKQLAVSHIALLRQLPLSFLPSLLKQVIDYDYMFPAERKSIEHELAQLASLPANGLKEWFHPFEELSLSSGLENYDWINQPAQFVEQQSAHLWSTHQLDAFSKAATDYGNRLNATITPEPLPVRRLGIAIVGQGVSSYEQPLFRNLRKHGTYFGHVNPDGGLDQLLQAAAQRAEAHPIPYAHWYVDGGLPANHTPQLTRVSYDQLQPMREALLKNIQAELQRPGMGPEELRTHLARLVPSDLGVRTPGDQVLDRFQMKVLTEGSGTQIFSTTFAQWTTREALRRAQPLTLLVRFAPRQRQRPMNELLSDRRESPQQDPIGSLVDADMAAYYHWINQQRLPGADQSTFLVWFEGHSRALVVAPTLPRGTESSSEMDLGKLLAMALD